MPSEPENLLQLQWRPSKIPKNTPLFLIHDGGGTIFSYTFLHDIDRDVWGISDALFGTDESWEGGISEMARRYVGVIKSVVSDGPIFVGGWSLGGMLSLEIAHHLRTDKKLWVQGLVMIDSPHPQKPHNPQVPPSNEDTTGAQSKPHTVTFPASTTEAMKKKVLRRFEEARKNVPLWNVPTTWDGTKIQSRKESWMYFPLRGNPGSRGMPGDSSQQGSRPPPALLVRATRRCQGVAAVDLSRDSELLNWENYELGFVEEVRDVDANHYDVFSSEEKVEKISGMIKDWCKQLDV